MEQCNLNKEIKLEVPESCDVQSNIIKSNINCKSENSFDTENQKSVTNLNNSKNTQKILTQESRTSNGQKSEKKTLLLLYKQNKMNQKGEKTFEFINVIEASLKVEEDKKSIVETCQTSTRKGMRTRQKRRRTKIMETSSEEISNNNNNMQTSAAEENERITFVEQKNKHEKPRKRQYKNKTMLEKDANLDFQMVITEKAQKEEIDQNTDQTNSTDNYYENETSNENMQDSNESDGLEEFLSAFEPKPCKYKPRKKPQLTEEQKAQKEKTSIEKRTCKVCDTIFAFPGGVRNHMRSKHTHEKPYSCEFCEEKFSIQSSYSLHRRRHLGIKPHLCNLCGKTFLRKMDLRIHMRIHIPSKDKIRDAKCNFCPKVYTSKINLKKHVLTKHTDPSEWKHECKICRKKLYNATALTHHIRHHNDDRRYKCAICGRKFFTKQNMDIHVRTHSVDTPFNCKRCSNGYRSNEALQRHLLKVHGIGEIKPVSAPTYFCPICNEGFRQKARLDQHVDLHKTGEEEYPYECEHCHRRYKARNYFTIHMLDKHGIKIEESYFKMFRLSQYNYMSALDASTEDINEVESDNTENVEYESVSSELS